jgi:ParB family transcriptional regulator, chromosome partitioning protein
MPDKNYVPTKYDSVFWVEVDRIQPNPYQPRIEFNEEHLKSLAESIRQYGVLQPLVVTSRDRQKEDGGLQAIYELIAGERRLRASKLIGLREVPVIIRVGEQSDKMKLELAIIENLQREDLNAIDRAKALGQLAETFTMSHSEIAAKIGRSREYVSNSIRLLQLPEAVQMAVVGREISEGHARALLMLSDRPAERDTLFKQIVLKKTSVRVVEQMARALAQDKIRKHTKTVEVMALEKSLTEALGTRVMIENRPHGGRMVIEFFSPEDLSVIAALLAERQNSGSTSLPESAVVPEDLSPAPLPEANTSFVQHPNTSQLEPQSQMEELSQAVENKETAELLQAVAPKFVPEDEDFYLVENFTV